MKLKLAVFTLFFIVPLITYGQGSGSSKDSKSTTGSAAKKNNFAIKRSVSGAVASVTASSISIRTKGKTTVFLINRNTKFVGGRPGQGERAKVTFLASNRMAFVIRRG